MCKILFFLKPSLLERFYHSLKAKFGDDPNIDKFVLIDNANVAKHKNLHSVFEEVFFVERFRKTKIVECNL